MKKIYLCLFAILTCVSSIFSQISYVEKYKHVDNTSTLLRIKITNEIEPNEVGGYGFRIKAPIAYTSFAIGWNASRTDIEAGKFFVYYKVGKSNGKWSNWKDDHGYHNPDNITPNIYFTDLLFGMDMKLHDSLDFYILPPQNVEITEIQLVFQNIMENKNSAQIETKSLNTREENCLEFPEYIARTSWCGTYQECLNPTYTPAYISNCTHTIIHHGASPDTYEDGAAVVRSYWNYHVNSNGWSDIGYNYLFDKYGNMFQGRYNPNIPTTDVKGAHAGNCNSVSIGLNFLGNTDAENTAVTTAQFEKCTDFLAWWYDNHEYDPTSMASITNQAGNYTFTKFLISGHRDVNQTSSGELGTTCPGQSLYDRLEEMRINVATKMNDCGWDIDIPQDDTMAPTSEIIADRWQNSNFTARFNDNDDNEIAYSFYQIADKNGINWSSNTNKGYLYEKFDEQAIPNGWRSASGTWTMNAGSVIQTDESLSNTDLHTTVNQESGFNYLYHVKMKIPSGESGNLRSGFNFFCTDTTRNNSYMLYIRASNGHAQLYRYIDGSYTSADETTFVDVNCGITADRWYDIKITHNTTTGEIVCYIDNNYTLTLHDDTPLSSGNFISLRTAGCKTEYKDLYILRSRNENVEVVLGETGDIRYESDNGQAAGIIRTILVDNAKHWSEYYEKNIYCDTTLPTSTIQSSQPWKTQNYDISFNDTDNSYVAEKLYNIKSFNGSKWTSNNNNGFANNDFTNEIGSEWTVVSGEWSILENAITQISTSGTSNIYSEIQQNISDKYLYEFDMKMAESSTNQRLGFHYLSSEGSSTNHGNGYFIYFRISTESRRVEFYRVENDVYSQKVCIDLPIYNEQWYNVKLLYDRTNGKSSLFIDNNYVGEYIDDNFFSEGNYVALRSGGVTAYYDNFKVYRSRTNTATISIGENGDIQNQSLYENQDIAAISTILIDSAHNISAINEITEKIDWSIPTTIANVYDGTGTDIDTIFEINSVSANWTNSTDINSGIAKYYYSIGTEAGATNIVNWTNNNTNTHFSQNIPLIPGTQYYINVKAENYAGLQSEVTSSNGVFISNSICPENFSICSNENAILLNNATQSDGTYYENGIEIESFDPSASTIGIHQITYTYEELNCVFEITVNEPAIISCPENIEMLQNQEAITLASLIPNTEGIFILNNEEITVMNPSDYEIGNYEITFIHTNEFNCESNCIFQIEITNPTNIEKVEPDKIQLYPNPNNGNFVISTSNFESGETIVIINTLGQIVYQKQIFDSNTEFSADIPAGIYYAKISNSVIKFIVE